MKTLIYSALFGNLRLCRKLHLYDSQNAECLLFSDRSKSDLQVDECWQVVQLHPWANPLTMVKIIKCFPMHLGDYDRSIWIDANVRCRRSLIPIFDDMGSADMACYFHARRKNADEELKHCARRRVDDVRRLNKTAQDINLIRFNLYWCGLLWRMHNPKMIDFGLHWMMKMFMGTRRDQITMAWAAEMAGVVIHEMSGRSIGRNVMVHNKR